MDLADILSLILAREGQVIPGLYGDQFDYDDDYNHYEDDDDDFQPRVINRTTINLKHDQLGLDRNGYYNDLKTTKPHKMIEKLIFQGNVPNLFKFVQKDNAKHVKMLVEFSYQNLVAAYRSGKIDMLNAVLKYGANVNRKIYGHYYPLQHVIRHDIEQCKVINIEMVQIMLKEMTESLRKQLFSNIVNDVERQLTTCTSSMIDAHIKSVLNMLKMFKELDVDVPNTCNEPPDNLTKLTKKPHLVAALIQVNPAYYNDVKFNTQQIEKILDACVKESSTFLLKILFQNDMIKAHLQRDDTSLLKMMEIALSSNNKDMTDYLLDMVKNISFNSSYSMSFLSGFCEKVTHSTLTSKCPELISLLRKLLEAPTAQLNIKSGDKPCRTVLHVLCQSIARNESLSPLLRHVVERCTEDTLNHVDSAHTRTALEYLVSGTKGPVVFSTNFISLVDLFLQHGYDVNAGHFLAFLVKHTLEAAKLSDSTFETTSIVGLITNVIATVHTKFTLISVLATMSSIDMTKFVSINANDEEASKRDLKVIQLNRLMSQIITALFNNKALKHLTSSRIVDLVTDGFGFGNLTAIDALIKRTPSEVIQCLGDDQFEPLILALGATFHDEEPAFYLTTDWATNLRKTDRRIIFLAHLILNRGLDVNFAEECGNTMLHQAIENDIYSLAAWLIVCGADVNARNDQGMTPFRMIKHMCHVPGNRRPEAKRSIDILVQLLLDYGADIEAGNSGKTKKTILHDLIDKSSTRNTTGMKVEDSDLSSLIKLICKGSRMTSKDMMQNYQATMLSNLNSFINTLKEIYSLTE